MAVVHATPLQEGPPPVASAHGNPAGCAHPAGEEEDNADPSARLAELEARLAEEAVARRWLAARYQEMERRNAEQEARRDAYALAYQKRFSNQEARLQEQEARLREQEARLQEQAARLQVQEALLQEQEARLAEQASRLRDTRAWTDEQLDQSGTWTVRRFLEQDARLHEQEARLQDQETRLREQEAQPSISEEEDREGQLVAAEAALKATLGIADPTLPPADGEIEAIPAEDGAKEDMAAHPAEQEAIPLPDKEGEVALSDKIEAVVLPTEEGEEAAGPAAQPDGEEAAASTAAHSAGGEVASIPATLPAMEAPIAPVPHLSQPTIPWGDECEEDDAADDGPRHKRKRKRRRRRRGRGGKGRTLPPQPSGARLRNSRAPRPDPGPALDAANSPVATPHPAKASTIGRSWRWRGRRHTWPGFPSRPPPI